MLGFPWLEGQSGNLAGTRNDFRSFFLAAGKGGGNPRIPNRQVPMSSASQITQWVSQLQSPDAGVREVAAQKLWNHYVNDLRRLVRQHLNERIRQRESESDVLQQAFGSFFVRKFEIDNCDELWKLLVTITLSKVRNVANYHKAGKRDYRRDLAIKLAGDDEPGTNNWNTEQLASGATPEHAFQVVEILEGLPEELRRIADLALQRYSNKEIATRIGRTERTVELKLQQIRKHLSSLTQEGG
jgi:RNA polymerase sigma factor (sigma-70 family)